MTNFLKELFLRWLIFRKGIRFYETTMIPKAPGFTSATFESLSGHQVEFYFYKETCEDIIFRRGKVFKEKFIGYVIQAKFDIDLPLTLRRYNNMKFFFNGKDFNQHDENLVVKKLLSIYLDLLRSEMKV